MYVCMYRGELIPDAKNVAQLAHMQPADELSPFEVTPCLVRKNVPGLLGPFQEAGAAPGWLWVSAKFKMAGFFRVGIKLPPECFLKKNKKKTPTGGRKIFWPSAFLHGRKRPGSGFVRKSFGVFLPQK